MPINTLTFNTNITGELDKAVAQKSVTGFLEDNALRAKFVGAKTVIISELGLSGLGDYDRDTGFTKGAVTLTDTPHVLAMDRGRSFQLDREDEDEAAVPGLAGKIMGEFVRTKVIPEMDAYVLSKAASYAVTKGQTVTGTPETGIAGMIADAMTKAHNAVGFDEELVALVDSAVWKAFQTTPELSRSVVISDFKRGEITTKVSHYNGMALIPVVDSRMHTAFDFYDGAEGDEYAGGFAPMETAQRIGFVVMPKKAVSLVKKTDKVRTFAPDQNLAADAWKLDYRIYYDAFIRNSLAGGIYTYVYEK